MFSKRRAAAGRKENIQLCKYIYIYKAYYGLSAKSTWVPPLMPCCPGPMWGSWVFPFPCFRTACRSRLLAPVHIVPLSSAPNKFTPSPPPSYTMSRSLMSSGRGADPRGGRHEPDGAMQKRTQVTSTTPPQPQPPATLIIITTTDTTTTTTA